MSDFHEPSSGFTWSFVFKRRAAGVEEERKKLEY